MEGVTRPSLNVIRKLGRRAISTGALLMMVGFLILLSSGTARAQNCDMLTPVGGFGDDAIQINNCLTTSGHATLLGYTFNIYQPIRFPTKTSNISLTGAGSSSTKIVTQFTCGASTPFVDYTVTPAAYQPVIQVTKVTNATLNGFTLNLASLRKDCGYKSNFAIVVDKSPGTQVTSLKINGSQYGQPDYTTGWSNGGGILFSNSGSSATRQSVISSNFIKDIAFTVETGGQTVGREALALDNSGGSSDSIRTLVQNNTILRAAFGIEIVNKSPSIGYTGDSSYTTVSGNSITGSAGIGCPDCAGGRALKFQACGVGDELPIRYPIVTNNIATLWGGQQALVSPSGMDLSCGVQYGTFSANNFNAGNATASYGLQIRGSFMSPQNASHHNVFTNNTFFAGGCSNGCFDVFFNDDGSDQSSGTTSGLPSIGRHYADGGNNTFGTMGDAGGYHGCSEFAHAWWQYPGTQTFINRGQSLPVSAAGIRPDSTKTVTFDFYNPLGVLVKTMTYTGGNGNCVMNQQLIPIDTTAFPTPGLYKVYATYWDGNSNAKIVKDWIGTLGQQATLDVR
jgi:hypothetical protein